MRKINSSKCQFEGCNRNFKCKIPIIESAVCADEHTELKNHIDKMIKATELMSQNWRIENETTRFNCI